MKLAYRLFNVSSTVNVRFKRNTLSLPILTIGLYTVFLFLLQTSVVASPVTVDKKEFTKTIKKEFGITADGTTSIYNKYGQINLQTWDKPRVKIEVTILVNSRSESEAQSVFDRISIDFSNGSDYVKAATEIESQKSGWWSWGDDKSDYNISYKVFLPVSNSIDISNKYGNVNAAAIEGSAKVAVKYGNFQLEGIGGSANIDLGYGNGTVVAAREVTSEISYSRILFRKAKELNLTTKYSKITIDEVNDIRSETKYDTYDIGAVRDFRNSGKYDSFDIGSADNVTIGSKYTELNVGRIGNSMDVDMQYGGANIGSVAKGFADIRIVGSYADFKIGVENGASYRMEATANYAGIRYPDGLNVTYEKEKGTYHEVEGHQGTKGARSIIKARLDYGGLKVQQN